MHKSERIDLRLSPRDVEILDTKRGPHTRSAYIRALIVQDKSSVTELGHPHPDPVVPPLPEPDPTAPFEPPIPSPISPPVPPPNPVETRHLHRFKKAGDPVEYRQAVPYYRQKCDCGLTRVAP